MSKNDSSLTNKAIESVLWKLLQNGGTTLISFLLQIWLARLLLPADYGLIALTSVFITLSMIIIQTGFTSALIQKPELQDLDIYSVHYSSIVLSMVIYGVVFAFAPFIARFYSEPLLVSVLRVQALTVPISALYSVPMSIIQRNLQMKRTFYAGIIGMVGQGTVGIILALRGFGVWALVFGSLTNASMTCIVILISSKWRPKLQFSTVPVQQMLPFSSRVLAIALINALSANMKALITGRAYSPEVLGYYNRGYQFPSMLMVNVDGAITSVAFPLLSRFQHDYTELANKVRKSLQISLYFVWPAMIGLIAVADPLIRLLLTEKWMPSVVFLQLTAIECMLWPFSIFIHATNAVGKSGLSLKLNILSKGLDLLVMLITIRFGIYVFVASTIFSSLLSTSVVVVIVSRIIKLPLKDLLLDVMPIFFSSLLMGAVVSLIGLLFSSPLQKILFQVLVGTLLYFVVTWMFRVPSLMFVLSYIKNKLIRTNEAHKEKPY